jgi:CRISPR/Cas system CSM-associated protein Csm3 (group 7 of RAMP superfamily)
MLRRRLCEATFDWRLSCEGPLLISDGRYEIDRIKQGKQEAGKYPDKLFVSRSPIGEVERKVRGTLDPGRLDLDFYVPGTSLRGPLRAQAERIVRSLLADGVASPVTACDPFEDEREPLVSCSKRLDRQAAPVPYAAVCPACKLFGCTHTASRLHLTDAEFGGTGPAQAYRSVYRDMIGIDRLTGGVHSGANMRFHALEKTSFTTAVTVLNFELWHLGLLAYALRDFEEGQAAIGSGKTKGFGRVRGGVGPITLTYPRGRAQGRLADLWSLSSPEERQRYGLVAAPEEARAVALGPPQRAALSLYETFVIEDPAVLWEKVAPAFNAMIETRGRGAAA